MIQAVTLIVIPKRWRSLNQRILKDHVFTHHPFKRPQMFAELLSECCGISHLRLQGPEPLICHGLHGAADALANPATAATVSQETRWVASASGSGF